MLETKPATEGVLGWPGRVAGTPIVLLLVRRWWVVGVLGATVTIATLLALLWVFLVPIFQAPDEPAHLDYALSIYSMGRPVTVREVNPTAGMHPYTLYLLTRSGFLLTYAHPELKMAPGYGTPAYYQALDRQAPSLKGLSVRQLSPALITLYPFGYYALVAIWLGLISQVSSSVTVLFFAARILSVLLLVGSLLLSYGIARELRVRRPLALLLTAIIGCFPLTTFVSAYIQPDNLSWFLVSLSLYLAMLVRRKGGHVGALALLGLVLGYLLVTKYQFYICTLLPILGLLVTQELAAPARRRWHWWLVRGALLFLPALALGLVQLWVSWGGHFAITTSPTVGAALSYAPAKAAFSRGWGPLLIYVITGLNAALKDFYLLEGNTAASYWGLFGWLNTPLVFGSLPVTAFIARGRVFVTGIILLLTLMRLVSIGGRLGALARVGRGRQAARIACSNPVLNSYFLFTVFMFAIYILTNNGIGAQGRNWLPYILPAFLLGTSYAPRLLGRRLIPATLTAVLMVGLVFYSAFGSYYAVQTNIERYYGSGRVVRPLAVAGMSKLTTPSQLIVDYFYSDLTLAEYPLTLSRGGMLALGGWAVDSVHRSLAEGVFVSVDGSYDIQAAYGADRPDVAQALREPAYRKSGFDIIFPTRDLAPGKHVLTLKIVSRDRRSYYTSTFPLVFVIK